MSTAATLNLPGSTSGISRRLEGAGSGALGGSGGLGAPAGSGGGEEGGDDWRHAIPAAANASSATAARRLLRAFMVFISFLEVSREPLLLPAMAPGRTRQVEAARRAFAGIDGWRRKSGLSRPTM